MENRKTLFMFLPWSTDLTGYFYTNIADMEACVSRRGLEHERILVFMSTSSTEATMFEIIHSKGKCDRKTLKRYGTSGFTTVEGITGILNDVQEFAPAPVYGVYFSHASETPGLGAEIATDWFQHEFAGKKTLENGAVALGVVKNGKVEKADYQVDGISGGTITSVGVDAMLKACLNNYISFLTK